MPTSEPGRDGLHCAARHAGHGGGKGGQIHQVQRVQMEERMGSKDGKRMGKSWENHGMGKLWMIKGSWEAIGGRFAVIRSLMCFLAMEKKEVSRIKNIVLFAVGHSDDSKSKYTPRRHIGWLRSSLAHPHPFA